MKHPYDCELLKAYCALIVLEAVMAVLGFLLLPQSTNIIEVMNQTPLQKTLGVVTGIYSFGMFIFSIVVCIRWRKEQWSWKLKLLPKLRIILPSIMLVVGTVVSLQSAARFLQSAPTFDQSKTPTPEQLQSLMPAGVTILSTISLGITVVLGIYALLLLLQLLQRKHE